MPVKYNRLRTVQMPGKVALACAHCSTPLWVWPSDIKGLTNVFCNRACMHAARRRPDRICEECGATYQPYSRNPQKFCGTKCQGAGRTKAAWASFWDYVNKDGPIPVHCSHLGSCWIWLRAKQHSGHGVALGMRAHQAAWLLTYGSIPDGLHVLHHCDNPPCVRPEHLHLGTHPDNMREASERRRFPYGTDWKQAHGSGRGKFTPDIVRKIRARFAAGGITKAALAREYRVKPHTIIKVIRRETWPEVV